MQEEREQGKKRLRVLAEEREENKRRLRVVEERLHTMEVEREEEQRQGLVLTPSCYCCIHVCLIKQTSLLWTPTF